MKRYLIFIPIIIILLLAVVISIALHVDTFEVMTVPRSYSYVSTYTDNDEMDVLVYVSSQNSYITKKENIKNAYVTSSDENNTMKVDLIDIQNMNNNVKIYGHYFYLYKFSFDIPFKTTSEYELSINDALLMIDYGTREIAITLGSFYYYKMPYYGDLDNDLVITSLKPVIGYIGDNKTVSGIRIGLRNNALVDITICDIKLLDPNIYPSLGEIKVIDNTFGGLESMSSILGYNYEIKPKEKEEGEVSLKISKNKEIEIVIPIKYLEDYPINTLGFIISYKESGNSEIIKYYYDDFVFFNSMKETYDESKVVINTYENN